MARQRPKQLEPNRIGSSKLGFDGEEDGWVFVKKQRVIIVLPSLPLPEPLSVEKPPPATSHPQAAELRDSVEASRVVVGPSLPLVLQKPETCQSLVELRDVIAADIHKSTPAYTTVSSSLPRPQDFIWQKRVTSQSQAELKTTLHSVVPSLPLPEPFVFQKPASSQLQAELRDGIADVQKATPVHTVVPYVPVPEPQHRAFKKLETSQTRAEFRADKQEASLVHTTVVPSLPVTEHINLQKPATSKSQADLRARKATLAHPVVPYLPITEHITFQKNPATSHSQADLRAKERRKSTLVQPLVPALPVTEHTPLQKPATSQSLAEETRKAPLGHSVVPSLPVYELITLQKPATSQSKAEETRNATVASTVRPFLPATEHRTLQKPVTSQTQAELRAKETLKATRVQPVAPSLPVLQHCTLQKPATSQSQAELRAQEIRKATLANTVVSSLPVTEHYTLQKPATSQSQASLRAKGTPKATIVQAVMPSLPVLDYCTLQKPARDFASDAQETADFQAVDKPERVMDRRKAPPPGPRRSLQDPHRRMLATQRTRGAGHNKPVRFPRVMCSSVAMDNEKLRVVNLEKKVERAGGLNEWVGSIGLGREFERMLRGQRMSKFQMANLTMEKLKQMGALAVGPRRKLIHAIRCVYHPHCLRASFH